jgi:hypothetical protein
VARNGQPAQLVAPANSPASMVRISDS